MKRTRILFLAVFLLVAGSLIFGAGQGQSTASGADNKVLSLGYTGTAGGTDIMVCPWLSLTSLTSNLLYDSLLLLNFEGNIAVYRLAESYTVSPDGLTYTFNIRSNVKWHDGVPFTTDDIVWSLKTFMKVPQITTTNVLAKFLNIKGMREYLDGRAQDVSGITSTAKTVTFTLNSADFTFLVGIASFPPLPKHLLEKEDPLTVAVGPYWATKSVGTGAYCLEQFMPNSYLRLKTYNDYYGEKPKIPNVNITLFSDNQASDAFTLSGKNDFLVTGNYSMTKQYVASGYYNSTILDVNYCRIFFCNLMGVGKNNNSGNTKILDIRVRQALIFATDLQKICDTIFEGGASPEFSYVNKASQYYDSRYNQYTYDPVKAKQLLAEAGYPFSEKLIIGTYYLDQQTADLLEAIASYWRAIGLTVEVIFMPAGIDSSAWLYDQKPYDFCYGGASVGKNLDLFNGFFPGNPVHESLRGRFVDGQAFERTFARFSSSNDLNERKAAASELQRLEAQYMPMIPLFHVPNYMVTNKRLNLNIPGLRVEGNFPTYFGFEKWTLAD